MGAAIEGAIIRAIVALIVFTASATVAIVFGVPWLWGLLKPILRGWLA